MDKTWKVTLSLLLAFSVILDIFTLGVIHKVTTSSYEEQIDDKVTTSSHEKRTDDKVTTSSYEEWLDELDQRHAEWHFWHLKGKINEIHLLSIYPEIPKEVLQSHLEDIVNYQNFECAIDKNHYISDFKFVTPDSSTVGELCSILGSQINDYIISL